MSFSLASSESTLRIELSEPPQQAIGQLQPNVPSAETGGNFQTEVVFSMNDGPIRTSMPKPKHWSIAWSDLMMTMFILFLSMFVYQAATNNLLVENKPEVVAGDTMPVADNNYSGYIDQPIVPISRSLPIATDTRLTKEKTTIQLKNIEIRNRFGDWHQGMDSPGQTLLAEKLVPKIKGDPRFAISLLQPEHSEEVVQPMPLYVNTDGSNADDLQQIYRLSKKALNTNKLDTFVEIALNGDDDLCISLAGDLFFDAGRATLNRHSRIRLEKLASAIRETPNLINVVGHTDNLPMRSTRFASNWELSLARASAVTRFLIENMGMNPKQFVVSGYSSYRPLLPNTSNLNRAGNRRVEIVISKNLPALEAAQRNI